MGLLGENRSFFAWAILALLIAHAARAQPVFPGAEGLGTDTRAAYGHPTEDPVVLRVTNLDASGSGSLNDALRDSRPRVVIFEVSGTIVLTGSINIRDPYLTVAGQTAPDPGVMVRGASLVVSTHDVLIQHLRIRPGDDPAGPDPGNRDALDIEDGAAENDVYNVVVDHCSLSWSLDETLTYWWNTPRDCTVSNCIISEGLSHSLHPQGEHSKAFLVGPDVHNVSIVKNLFAHNKDRNPRFNAGTGVAIINNVNYNPYWWGAETSGAIDNPTLASVAGNKIVKGPETNGSNYILNVRECNPASQVYVSDNDCANYQGDDWDCVDNRPGHAIQVSVPPVSIAGIDVKTSAEVEDWVLAHAGARPADRDTVDERIIADVIARTGQYVDCVSGGSDSINHTGTAQGGTASTIVIATDSQGETAALRGFLIRITAGTGSGQSREISDNDEGTKVVDVTPDWNTVPNTTSQYEIYSDCTKNAGGWPILEENTRPLTLPDRPHQDDDNDGYTNLEEWLHDYAHQVETGTPPDTTPPAAPANLQVTPP